MTDATSLQRYRAVRARTVELAAPLSAEDQLVQSMPDASPTKWHLAHTSWFFETFVLAPRVADYRVLDGRYAFLFNSYYETVGAHVARPARGLLSRPSLAEVHAYRRHVDDAMARLLEAGGGDAVCELGLHHEQQHQELILTDIKHALGTSPLRPAYAPAAPGVEAAPGADEASGGWRELEEGLTWIGAEPGGAFAFDNEGPRHRVYLRAFALAERPVTCGEYLRFMRDGGYERPELWLSDGWLRCRAERWRAPLYWQPGGDRGDEWVCYTLTGLRSVDPREAVAHVSYYEADAFARWAGARLPTEEEWERAAQDVPVEGRFGQLHPGVARAGRFGDVWQWTQSAYAAYPGYRPPSGALGEYNGKFMCNQMVLRGGSCFTPEGHVRATYRNFFPPEARWQASGVRLARDA